VFLKNNPVKKRICIYLQQTGNVLQAILIARITRKPYNNCRQAYFSKHLSHKFSPIQTLTVGFRITLNQPYSGQIRFADYTAGRGFHPTPKIYFSQERIIAEDNAIFKRNPEGFLNLHFKKSLIK